MCSIHDLVLKQKARRTSLLGGQTDFTFVEAAYTPAKNVGQARLFNRKTK